MQLLFHNISWYVAFEMDAIGTQEGLIRALRVDRLVLHGTDGAVRRSRERDHERAMARLEMLLHISGGLYFGTSLQGQLAVMSPTEASAWFTILRFSCTEAVFALIQEEPNRFPREHTTIAAPNPPGDSHPHAMEVRLPRWTVQDSWELRSWLYRWGAGIRIEQLPSARCTPAAGTGGGGAVRRVNGTPELVVRTSQGPAATQGFEAGRSETIPMSTLPPSDSSALDALITHLQANLHQPLRLIKDLEIRTHYSRRSLQYAFRRELGCSPMQWIHEQRLARAMALLQTHGRQISIQAVAVACGYRHSGQLSALFKRRYGVSPSQIQRDLTFQGWGSA